MIQRPPSRLEEIKELLSEEQTLKYRLREFARRQARHLTPWVLAGLASSVLAAALAFHAAKPALAPAAVSLPGTTDADAQVRKVRLAFEKLLAALEVAQTEKREAALGSLVPAYLPQFPSVEGPPNPSAWSYVRGTLRYSGASEALCKAVNPEIPLGFQDKVGLQCHGSEGRYALAYRKLPLPEEEKGFWIISAKALFSGRAQTVRLASDGRLHAHCPENGRRLGYSALHKQQSAESAQEALLCLPAFKDEPVAFEHGTSFYSGAEGLVVDLVAGGVKASAYIAGSSRDRCLESEEASLVKIGFLAKSQVSVELQGSCGRPEVVSLNRVVLLNESKH